MASANPKPQILGYLPNERPPFGQMLVLGFQHVLTMFPATVLVALLVGFHVSTVLAISGLATLVALIGSRVGIGKFIPLYYGSSFSYIAATVAITGAEFGVPASDELISTVQAGFLVTGVLNILVGLAIRAFGGKRMLDKILPPVLTGSVACVIGIGLGKAALDMANGAAGGVPGDLRWWFVAVVTLLSCILFSVYLQGRGFVGMLPVLLGAVVGYLVAIPLGLVNFSQIGQSAFITAPHITFPSFSSEMTMTVVFGIGIMCIATIPESTAHLYQISLYVDHLAEEVGKEAYQLSRYIGFNLVLDGIGDFINGMFGGAAGTNYGENNALMVITRNYSGPVLIAAAIFSMLLGFSGWLADAVRSVPTAVSGGLAIYLFGVIGMQGIALMISERVNLFDPSQLAIGAVVLVIGVGGNIGYPGGFLPVPLLTGIFPQGWPAIATAAVAGILLNAIFLIWKPPVVRGYVEAKPTGPGLEAGEGGS